MNRKPASFLEAVPLSELYLNPGVLTGPDEPISQSIINFKNSLPKKKKKEFASTSALSGGFPNGSVIKNPPVM